MTRPLVLPIPAGAAPGGLVFRVTDHHGTVLSYEPIRRSQAEAVEALAEWQAIAAADSVRPGEPTYLNVFDGDTGECVYTLVCHL